MTVIVDLQNVCQQAVPDASQFQRWVEAVLENQRNQRGQTRLISRHDPFDSFDFELSIRLVDEAESAELNEKYRSKIAPTNVLSFPFDSPIPLVPILLGDLVICASVVEKEALIQNKAIQDHWAHMVVHGCLHLLAYDHSEDQEAQVMEALEVTILQSLSINDPYQE